MLSMYARVHLRNVAISGHSCSWFQDGEGERRQFRTRFDSPAILDASPASFS